MKTLNRSIDWTRLALSVLIGALAAYCVKSGFHAAMPKLCLYGFYLLIFAGITQFAYRTVPRLWNSDDTRTSDLSGSKRNASIDLVRALASFFVLYVHSCTLIGYYSTPVSGPIMFVMTVFRWIAINCVPLFLLMSGYLCIRRLDIRKTYVSLNPYYLLFLVSQLYSIVTVDGYDIRNLISIPPMLGYFESYIGLVFLMPFLNRLWNALEDPSRKVLVVVLLLSTALPSVSLIEPPIYWLFLYPVTY